MIDHNRKKDLIKSLSEIKLMEDIRARARRIQNDLEERRAESKKTLAKTPTTPKEDRMPQGMKEDIQKIYEYLITLKPEQVKEAMQHVPALSKLLMSKHVKQTQRNK
jgi:uncharacterized protein YydD (DUF2326 family)